MSETPLGIICRKGFERNKHRLSPFSVLLWCLSAAISSVPLAHSQEALRNSLAGDAAAEAHVRQMDSQPYTLKNGDFKLLVTPSFETDWNDNVNLSKSDPQQDFILKPNVRLQASYPLTRNNLLNQSIGLGYDKYLSHDELSTWRLDSGSQLSFDIFVKDWKFDLHDRFHYTQDSAQTRGRCLDRTLRKFSECGGRIRRLGFGRPHLNFCLRPPERPLNFSTIRIYRPCR